MTGYEDWDRRGFLASSNEHGNSGFHPTCWLGSSCLSPRGRGRRGTHPTRPMAMMFSASFFTSRLHAWYMPGCTQLRVVRGIGSGGTRLDWAYARVLEFRSLTAYANGLSFVLLLLLRLSSRRSHVAIR